MLKELRNCISRIIRLWSLFCSIRVYASLHFPLCAFGIFCLLHVEFDVISITLCLHNLCLYTCQVICVFVLTYEKQFARHESLSIAFN